MAWARPQDPIATVFCSYCLTTLPAGRPAPLAEAGAPRLLQCRASASCSLRSIGRGAPDPSRRPSPSLWQELTGALTPVACRPRAKSMEPPCLLLIPATPAIERFASKPSLPCSSPSLNPSRRRRATAGAPAGNSSYCLRGAPMHVLVVVPRQIRPGTAGSRRLRHDPVRPWPPVPSPETTCIASRCPCFLSSETDERHDRFSRCPASVDRSRPRPSSRASSPDGLLPTESGHSPWLRFRSGVVRIRSTTSVCLLHGLVLLPCGISVCRCR